MKREYREGEKKSFREKEGEKGVRFVVSKGNKEGGRWREWDEGENRKLRRKGD